MKDLKNKAVQIKGKDYVLVKDRILALAESNHEYSIVTEVKYYKEEQMWVVKATLTIDGQAYTGHAQEIIGDGYINKTSALENAETSAVGRACAMAGIGVLDSIASVDEINKATTRESYANKLGNCKDCGAPNRMSKKGTPYCSKFCWKKEKPRMSQEEMDSLNNYSPADDLSF